jgi:alpha-mannosidase
MVKSLVYLIVTGVVWPCLPSRGAVDQVVVVFKTHFDIGYTDQASNVVKRYRTTMIDDALKVVDQSRSLPPEKQFAWTIPGWPMAKILDDWPGQTPERQQRIWRAFKEGRFVVHALPFTTHTETLDLEDLVRGLGHASRLSRTAGLSLPRDAKMTDVPCHSWVIPTLLKNAGVDFLHLGCNAASSSPKVPRLFLWEGPDGSRLLTMYTGESYGTGLVAPADWPYRTWLALIHTGDNHGPPTPAEVTQLLDEAARKLPGVKVRIGRLSDFGDAILTEKANLPVVRGDMPDTWIHGPMCDPEGASLARNVRPALATAESLNTLLRAWGAGVADPSKTIAAAYEQSLLYGEHTWGGALYWVTKYSGRVQFDYGDVWKQDRAGGRFQRLEDSWAEHTSYIERARDLVMPSLDEATSALARSVAVSGPRVVVFNPLPWKRDGLVSFKRTGSFEAVQPAEGGAPQPLMEFDGAACFWARGLPPMGYRAYVPVKIERAALRSRADAAKGEIESPFFKAVIDPGRGCIRSLIDQRSGRELVDASAAQGLGQYLYEQFDSNHVAAYVKAYVKINTDWAINELGKPNLPALASPPYHAVSPKRAQLSVEATPLWAAATWRAGAGPAIPHAVTTQLRLYENAPLAEIEITLHDKPATPRPEAGWLCLPFRMDSPQFRLGRQASIVDPARDIVPGANRNLYTVNTGVGLFDADGRGVGVCPLDHSLVSLDHPGCWQYSLDFVPKRPAVYVNLFNNQWTTNFRLWNEGTWKSRVRLWATDHFEAGDGLVNPSLESRYPLVAGFADGAPGKLKPASEGLGVSRKGVLVTAFGPNPDGAGTVLRFWELAGQSGQCQVELPADFTAATAQPVNLRGAAKGNLITVRDSRWTCELKAFAPASFVLNP